MSVLVLTGCLLPLVWRRRGVWGLPALVLAFVIAGLIFGFASWLEAALGLGVLPGMTECAVIGTANHGAQQRLFVLIVCRLRELSQDAGEFHEHA